MSRRPFVVGVSVPKLARALRHDDTTRESALGGILESARRDARVFLNSIITNKPIPREEETAIATVLTAVHLVDRIEAPDGEELAFELISWTDAMRETSDNDLLELLAPIPEENEEEEVEPVEDPLEELRFGPEEDEDLTSDFRLGLRELELIEELRLIASYIALEVGRPIFGQEMSASWSFYSYITAGELRLMLQAREEMPAIFTLSNDENAGVNNEFFLWCTSLADRGYDLFFGAS